MNTGRVVQLIHKIGADTERIGSLPQSVFYAKHELEYLTELGYIEPLVSRGSTVIRVTPKGREIINETVAALDNVTVDALVEQYAVRMAIGNNGGNWETHYTEEQKQRWRERARDLVNDVMKAVLEGRSA